MRFFSALFLLFLLTYCGGGAPEITLDVVRQQLPFTPRGIANTLRSLSTKTDGTLLGYISGKDGSFKSYTLDPANGTDTLANAIGILDASGVRLVETQALLSPDGSQMAVVCSGSDNSNELHLFDLTDRNTAPSAKIQSSTDSFEELRFSNDSQLLAFSRRSNSTQRVFLVKTDALDTVLELSEESGSDHLSFLHGTTPYFVAVLNKDLSLTEYEIPIASLTGLLKDTLTKRSTDLSAQKIDTHFTWKAKETDKFVLQVKLDSPNAIKVIGDDPTLTDSNPSNDTLGRTKLVQYDRSSQTIEELSDFALDVEQFESIDFSSSGAFGVLHASQIARCKATSNHKVVNFFRVDDAVTMNRPIFSSTARNPSAIQEAPCPVASTNIVDTQITEVIVRPTSTKKSYTIFYISSTSSKDTLLSQSFDGGITSHAIVFSP